MSTLVISGRPDQFISGGAAARHDELVVRRLASRYRTVKADDTADWFKRARIEECRFDNKNALTVLALSIKISCCLFRFYRSIIIGDAIEVEDCFFENGVDLYTVQCDYARCLFKGDVLCSKPMTSDVIPHGEYRFRDCAFVGVVLVVWNHATLEFAGSCIWDQLVIQRGIDCDIALRVDGRAVGAAEASGYGITLY